MSSNKQFPERIEVDAPKGTKKKLEKIGKNTDNSVATLKRRAFKDFIETYERS